MNSVKVVIGSLALLASVTLACGARDDSVGGETHWVTCDTDRECRDDRACVCGSCTSECETDADCSALGTSARCYDAERTDLADACGERVSRLCVLPSAVNDPTDDAPAPDDAPDDESDDASGSDDPASDDGCVGEAAATNPACETCFGRYEAESTALQELAQREDLRACETADDCVVVSTSSACADRCGAIVAETAADEFTALANDVVERYCDAPGYAPDCHASGSCVAGEPACEAGLCVRDTPGGAACDAGEVLRGGACSSCADVAALARTALDTALAGELTACDVDEDCEMVAAETLCQASCGEAIASAELEAFQAALAANEAEYCFDDVGEAILCEKPDVDCRLSIARCEGGQCVARADDGEPPSGIVGRAYDAERGCFEGRVATGGTRTCPEEGCSCDDALTAAVSPGGECLLFNDSCFPDGYRYAELGDECYGRPDCASLSVCDPSQVQHQGTCFACQADAATSVLSLYREGACETTDDCGVLSPELSCYSGGGVCPLVIAEIDRGSAEAALTQLETSLCSVGAGRAVCEEPAVECGPALPACVAGVCTSALPISGAPYDAANGCFLDDAFAGDAACVDGGAALTYALDPSGNCWLFPSTCIPIDFTSLEPDSDEACASSFETCSASTPSD